MCNVFWWVVILPKLKGVMKNKRHNYIEASKLSSTSPLMEISFSNKYTYFSGNSFRRRGEREFNIVNSKHVVCFLLLFSGLQELGPYFQMLLFITIPSR